MKREEHMKAAPDWSGGTIAGAILLSLAVMAAAQLTAFGIGGLAGMIGLPAAVCNIVVGILYAVFVVFGICILCRKLLDTEPPVCRMTGFLVRPVWAAAALIMPLLVCVVLTAMPGHFIKSPLSPEDIRNVVTGGVFFYGMAAGIVEEAVFRGVIMSVLEARFNRWVAVLAPSVLFGLAHLGGSPGVLSAIQLILAGTVVAVLFSLVTLESGSIWCSALMHGVWNVVMIGGILQIGTEADPTSIFSYVLDTKSQLLTGGAFGVEASLVSIAVYLLFIGLAVLLIRRKEGSGRVRK